MADVYPDGADQTMDDPDWMLDVDNRGWVALTKDASIVRAHRNDLESSSLQMFSLDSSKLTGEQMVARFELHLNESSSAAPSRGRSSTCSTPTRSSADIHERL